jgi:hypothetical protein
MAEQSDIFRSIAISLDDFAHVHGPHDGSEHLNHLFVGRAAIIDKLVDLLRSPSRRGSYLIAGYRGSGKTSVIRKAIEKYRNPQDGEKPEPPLVVNINLGDNSQLTPLNIYYSIASLLRDEILRTYSIASLLCDEILYKEHIARFFKYRKILKHIDNLLEQMSFQISSTHSAGLNRPVFGIASNLLMSKQKKRLPINAREAEERLYKILEQIQGTNQQIQSVNPKIVLVLDEIDKLSDNEEFSEIQYQRRSSDQESSKINRINSLLGSLKNFVTTASATFFFISGRETLDRYYSEKGSSNSLYESLFDRVFEVPSLLTDQGERPRGTQLSALIEEYVCRRIRKKRGATYTEENWREYYTLKALRKSLKENLTGSHPHTEGDIRTPEYYRIGESDIRYIINVLRNFIHYLTFHSWGNPKKLSSIFESFIVPKNQIKEELQKRSSILITSEGPAIADRWLVFNSNNQRSFSLASEITTLFQHQLSREVSKISDKLTVSTLSSLHFILKLHSYGFTRESLHRMSEAINVYRSPELNTIIDDLITHVFKSYTRRVRNGIYRYRFNSGFEQELRYISHVSELESATYNFSLDSMRHVKRFFEEILANSDGKETGVISRSHITLGDICAIEQSYTAASVHYSTASRILSNVLGNGEFLVNQETLMQYIEAMVKHGDLEERRQNYNHAAAIYFEADRVVKDFSLKDGDLLLQLRKGDSKWDLLKQPFWASRFLSLKRSPSKIELELPRHLYDWRDQRFHYRAANLLFFLGEGKCAAEHYEATLRFANKNVNLQFADERSAYLSGKAQIGLIEGALIDKSRELSNIYSNSKPESSTREKKRKCVIELLEFAYNPRVTFSAYGIPSGVKPGDIGCQMNDVAQRFEQNRLYVSAAITHIKTISYYTAILDVFDNSIFSDEDKKEKLLSIYEGIVKRGADAIRCINKARQLETSKSNKTLLIYDLESGRDAKEKNITKLLDLLLGPGRAEDYPIDESVFWQNSLWAHKLASTLYWADYVKRKIENKVGNTAQTYKSNTYISDNLLQNLAVSGFSVRPAILMRWICARDLRRRYIDNKLIIIEDKKYNVNDILESLSGQSSRAKLTRSGKKVTKYISLLFDTNGNHKVIRKDIPEALEKAYLISRYLYFAQESGRIISRKNLDLIFPRLSQIYFTQWELLINLISAMLVNHSEITKNTGEWLNSVRDFSFLLQRAFVAIDQEFAPEERIAPSHFDYEFIYLRLSESLESSSSLIDRTSRTHTGIFQHKYFCHDDHNDPDFRMDYTLACMFTPLAQYLHDDIKETHALLCKSMPMI